MSTGQPVRPPVWDGERLEQDRSRALSDFVTAWSQRPAIYEEAFRQVEPLVRRLFEASSDLGDVFVRRGAPTDTIDEGQEVDGARVEVFTAHPDLVAPARFLTGPPISEDYLKGMLGRNPGRRIDSDLAKEIITILNLAWDPIRFPWLRESRAPGESERDAAIRWTAGLWAVERCRTRLRNDSSKDQEKEVRELLAIVGYRAVTIARDHNIVLTNALPEGSFSSRGTHVPSGHHGR